MAAAWNTCLSFDPPLFGVSISPKRFTHHMIQETGEFTCSFLSMEHVEIIQGTGTASGQDYEKVTAFNIPLEDSEIIKCPVIESAYAAYECKLKYTYPVGDHDLFVGEVVAIHSQEGILSEKGILDAEKLNFAMYIGSDTYISANPLTLKEVPREISIPPNK